MNNKIVLIMLLMSLMVVTVGLSIGKQAQANILHDLGDGVDNYRQGKRDGIDAGARGDSDICPSSSNAYCLGWGMGYARGQDSREDVEHVYNGDNDDDD
jgi:hypothetical protein